MTRVVQEYLSSGLPAGVIPASDPPEFPDNFGETSRPRGTRTAVPSSFLQRSRFENRKLEQAAVSSPSSPECDQVLRSPLSPPLVSKLSAWDHRARWASFQHIAASLTRLGYYLSQVCARMPRFNQRSRIRIRRARSSRSARLQL